MRLENSQNLWGLHMINSTVNVIAGSVLKRNTAAAWAPMEPSDYLNNENPAQNLPKNRSHLTHT